MQEAHASTFESPAASDVLETYLEVLLFRPFTLITANRGGSILLLGKCHRANSIQTMLIKHSNGSKAECGSQRTKDLEIPRF
jgi:hypothetical protein